MGQKKSFLLRIDAELWKSLERWAQEELRSVNGQIEYVLKEAVNKKYAKKGTRISPDETDSH
jgi:hypothetical protein